MPWRMRMSVVVCRPSVCPWNAFSEKPSDDLMPNFWKGTYSPYLQNCSFPFSIFGVLNFNEHFFVFVNMRNIWGKFFKMPLLIHLSLFFNQTCSKYSLLQYSQKLLIRILYLKILKIEIFVNMGPMGSKNFKLLLLRFWFFFGQTFPSVSCNNPCRSCFLEILIFQI